jgi:hypothetical protein
MESAVMMRKLAALALIGSAAMATSAGASTRIGATALEAGAWGSQDCFGPALFIQAASADVSYVVPGGGGVITSWSAHGFGQPAQLVLKTVSPTSLGNYVLQGSSRPETVAPSGTSTFPARLSVAAGDVIALWVPAIPPNKAPCNYVTGNSGDLQVYRYDESQVEPAPGDAYGPTDQQISGSSLNLSAKVEPDADRDGFGDETQDRCPTQAADQGRCVDRLAPETTITRAPGPRVKTKRKRARVRFVFRASESAIFSCTLDGVSKPCSSPFRARVKQGKHRFNVVATDAAGNAEASPAHVRFRVRRT